MPASQTFVKQRIIFLLIFVENLKQMEISKVKKEEILLNAEILLWKTQLLIEACDSWLPAEEGNRNMEKRIQEKKKKR